MRPCRFIAILLFLLPCIAVFAQGNAETSPAASAASADSGTPIESAIEEFKTITRARGLRKDSPKPFQAGGGKLPQYHGRLTYNLRNDVFDAIPHQIRQRGEKRRSCGGISSGSTSAVQSIFQSCTTGERARSSRSRTKASARASRAPAWKACRFYRNAAETSRRR